MDKDVKPNLIAIFDEQFPVLDLLSESQCCRLLKSLILVCKGEVVDFSDLPDDDLLKKLWPCFYGPLMRYYQNWLSNKKRSASMEGKKNAQKNKTIEEPNITVQ